jgi:lipopolysaccharide biosynthesis glycosyltransferase
MNKYIFTCFDSDFFNNFGIQWLSSLKEIGKYKNNILIIDFGLSEKEVNILSDMGVIIIPAVNKYNALVVDRFVSLKNFMRDNDGIYCHMDGDMWAQDDINELFNFVNDDKLYCTFDKNWMHLDNVKDRNNVGKYNELLKKVIREYGYTLQAGLIVGKRNEWLEFINYMEDKIDSREISSFYGADQLCLNLFYVETNKVSVIDYIWNCISDWFPELKGNFFYINNKKIKMIHWVGGFRGRSINVFDFKMRFPDIYNKWNKIFNKDLDTIKKKILKHHFSLMKDSHFKEIKSIQVEDSSKVAICFVANKKYIDGLKVAVSSIRRNHANVPTIILLSDDIEEMPQGVDKLIKIDEDDYRHLEIFPDLHKMYLWPKSIFYKLSIFNVRGYDRIIFIDADMLVIRDISDLWDLDKYNEFDFYATYTAPQYVGTDKEHKDNLCSAIMVINKNLLNVKVYKKLIEMAVLHKSYDGSDQGVINYYLRTESVTYGLMNQFYQIFPCDPWIKWGYEYKEHEKPARILHFVGGWKKFTSWYDRIHQKHFKQEYIDLYDEYGC